MDIRKSKASYLLQHEDVEELAVYDAAKLSTPSEQHTEISAE